MKLALGTAQFGLDYGISNKNGIVSESSARSMLKTAKESGVLTIDTALSYGSSEKVLGNCINENNFEIITKSCQFKDLKIYKKDADILEVEFNKSLSRLQVDSVYGFMIHLPENLITNGGEWLFDRMCNLREKGKISKIGVSIYTPLDVDIIISLFDIDIIQVPISVFDQRLIEGGQLSILKKNNIEIHARSIFLQGLLLMDSGKLPPYFHSIQNILKEFHNLAEDLNISPLKLCIDFVKNITEIDKIVCGASSNSEFKELIECFSQKSTSNNINFEKYSIHDLDIINPSRWR
jgi:aryl-alcohol dehydrogenase-like predicted oxidoreductase